MFFFFNQKYCSRTQVASPPTPLRKERGVITVIPLVVRRYFHTLLLKQTVSCTPPLCRRGGRGVRLFFYYAKREDVKSSFTSSLLGYILFSVPFFQLPTTCISTRILLYLLPSLHGKDPGRVCWVTFYLLSNVDWSDAVHLKLSWSVSSISISNSW